MHHSFLWIYCFQCLDGDLCNITFIDLTDWSLIKISAKTAKFRSRACNDKKAPSFQKYLFIFWWFSVYQSFFLNWTLSYKSIVSCAILSDLVRWSFKKNSVNIIKFGSQKAEIRICNTGRTYSKFPLHKSFLRIYCFQYLDGDLCHIMYHSHRPHWLVTVA